RRVPGRQVTALTGLAARRLGRDVAVVEGALEAEVCDGDRTAVRRARLHPYLVGVDVTECERPTRGRSRVSERVRGDGRPVGRVGTRPKVDVGLPLARAV